MGLGTRQCSRWLFCFAFLLAGVSAVSAQTREPEYSDWPEVTRISGRVVVANDLKNLGGLERLSERIFGAKTVVVIQGEGDESKSLWRPKLSTLVGAEGQVFMMPDAKTLNATVRRYGSGSRGTVRPQTIAPEHVPTDVDAEKIRNADVVIAEDGSLTNSTDLSEFFQEVLARSGTVILEGQSGQQAGQYSMNAVGIDLLADAMSLVPGTLVTCAQEGQNAESKLEQRVSKLAATHGELVGAVLDPDTAFMLSGRKITCFGSGKLTMLVPESEVTSLHRQQISELKSRRQSPASSLIDLTQWRRLAMERQLPKFPPEKPPVPNVEEGTLLIVGGGGSPRGLMGRFVELAGGVEKAKLVYVPCAEEDELSSRQSMVTVWKRMGIKHATFVHTKDRKKADSDEAFLAPLKDATGIYFGGGRQWNFSDSYYGTTAHQLMKDVLARGGVIAGSSAGASIQGRYLARATPIGNSEIMAPGYERGGLGFLGGVAIDQHFSQRGRQKDMLQLMQTHPQLLGIGLDEATAIEVQKSTAKVTGRGRVFFYDAAVSESASGQVVSTDGKAVALSAGSVYDLANRTVILNASSAPETDQASPEND